MVKRGYAVFMGDYRNYGNSSREPAMDEPAAKNQPVTRSYLALRDIAAMVEHIKRKRGVKKVTLIGWSWGAMVAGDYASLYCENVHKLVLYAPLYNFNDHTSDRATALECRQHLCADPDHRRRLRHVVLPGGPGGTDARSGPRAGEEERPHPECHTFRAVREAALRLL